MGNFILRFDTKEGPRYLEYSTICDAPVTYGMTLAEFKKHYLREYGRTSERDFGERIKRVDAKGTSSHHHSSVADTIRNNRAGKDETRVTVEQLVDYYVVKRGRGAQPVGKKTTVEPLPEEEEGEPV